MNKKILKKVIDENVEALTRNEIMLGYVKVKRITNPENEALEKSEKDLDQQIKNITEFVKYLKGLK